MARRTADFLTSARGCVVLHLQPLPVSVPESAMFRQSAISNPQSAIGKPIPRPEGPNYNSPGPAAAAAPAPSRRSFAKPDWVRSAIRSVPCRGIFRVLPVGGRPHHKCGVGPRTRVARACQSAIRYPRSESPSLGLKGRTMAAQGKRRCAPPWVRSAIRLVPCRGTVIVAPDGARSHRKCGAGTRTPGPLCDTRCASTRVCLRRIQGAANG